MNWTTIMRRSGTLVLAGALVGAAATVAAQSRGPSNSEGESRRERCHRGKHARGHHGPPPHILLRIHAERLGIGSEALARIESKVNAARPEMEALREAFWIAVEENGRGSEQARQARRALRERRRALKREAASELTEEQRAAFRELMRERRGRSKRHRG